MNTLFFDYDVPDSCCAERPLHIPTYPRLVSTAATVREKTCGQTDKPTNRPTTITLRCARMRARGLMIHNYYCMKPPTIKAPKCTLFYFPGSKVTRTRRSPPGAGPGGPGPGGPGPVNITCVQYLLIQQFYAIHFAIHLVCL